MASTSEVYGKSTALPFQEDGDLVMGSTVKGRWSYACSKAIDEFLALAYWKERKLPTVVVRLFNTVGPARPASTAWSSRSSSKAALAARNLHIHGDGTQTRCFCHVEDTVRALVDLMTDERHYGEVFNVGSTEEISIEDLANRVIETTDSKSSAVKIPYDEAYEEASRT